MIRCGLLILRITYMYLMHHHLSSTTMCGSQEMVDHPKQKHATHYSCDDVCEALLLRV